MGWLEFDFENDTEQLLEEIERAIIKDKENEQVIFWLGDIDPISVNQFYLKRKTIIDEKKDKIYLVLNSPGGDIDAAYSLIEIIRANCSWFDVVIPLWAKSAATLISLAADRILMTSVGELGPLDTQIREPGDVQFKGALDEFKAMVHVRQEAFEAYDQIDPAIYGKRARQ